MGSVVLEVKTPQGAAVPDAAILAAYPNRTYVTGRTDADGQCRLNLYRTDQEMTVLIAAAGYLPSHTTIVPRDKPSIPLELEPSKDGRNAALFTKSTGHLPGIEGCINPHKDGYVYANNIAINGTLATPATHFDIGQPLQCIDVYGVETTVRFLVVEGQFSLIEYTDPKAYAGA